MGNLGRTSAEPSAQPPGTRIAADSKAVATLAAQLALFGIELHVVSKGGISYFEVRRAGEAYTCSTMHGVASIAARMHPARPVEVA